jgi:hypothetical protein
MRTVTAWGLSLSQCCDIIFSFNLENHIFPFLLVVVHIYKQVRAYFNYFVQQSSDSVFLSLCLSLLYIHVCLVREALS